MDPYQLGQVLLVAPEVSFAELDRDLQATGFERDREVGGGGPSPLVSGEPELAGWTWRGGKPLITYTFNPVVKLRLLDVGYVPPALRGTIAARVKLLEPAEVRPGLQSPDVLTRLRSLWAAAETDRLDLMETAKKMREDPDGVVAKAARDVAAKLQRAFETRVGVLANLRLLAESARGFLHRLNERPYVAGLAPRRSDIPLLFDEDIAGPVADSVIAEWERPPVADPGEAYPELKITAATAGLLRFPSELSDPFPRGYRDIAPWMVPNRVWMTWAWSNASGGMVRYDGLVWMDDHWAWLPRAFEYVGRVLEAKLGPIPETLH
ncbi:MAG TPA: hypothetical protein VFU23_09005 [Gemmatimonadales bacterium]|nr:hypothetical protein [Gemmatimonadales bacterium]